MKEYCLGSAELVHTPGLFRFLQAMYKHNPENAINIVTSGWSMLGPHIADGILNGTIETVLNDDEGTVVFTA